MHVLTMASATGIDVNHKRVKALAMPLAHLGI
jgi:hypothetical protein